MRTHPETGRRTLYVNADLHPAHRRPRPETRAPRCSTACTAQAAFPEYQCRFRWTPGDVAFWDNRATQHYAAADYFPQRRVMERITIVGDVPYWRAAAG